MQTISRTRFFWLLSYLSIPSVAATLITPALPTIQQQFNLSPGVVDSLVSVFLMGYVLGQLIYGPLANRWGRIRALQMGLVINIVGVLLGLWALQLHRFDLLVFSRFISALGAAGSLSCTFMLINEWLPDEQRKAAMAYAILSFTLGMGAAVLIGGWISNYSAWQYCFVALLIHAVVMCLGTSFLQETLQKPQMINVLSIVKAYKNALKSMNLVVFSLSMGFCTALSYCFSAAAPQIVQNTLRLSALHYAYWNLLNILGMLIGSLLAKFLLSRFKPIVVIEISLATCFAGILSLWVMWVTGSLSPLWFFLSTMSLYALSGFIFAGSSYLATNALSDKANGSSMMSFLNMSSGALSVGLMKYLAFDSFLAYVEILTLFWALLGVLLLVHQIRRFPFMGCSEVQKSKSTPPRYH